MLGTILCLWGVSQGQAGTPYKLTLVAEFENIPTQQLVASVDSLEHALYNTVFDNQVFWQGLSAQDRRQILKKSHQAISTGLGVRVVLPRVGRLKNVEFQLLPIDNGISQLLLIATNLVENKKEEIVTVPIKDGVLMTFVLDGDHLAFYADFYAQQQLEEVEQGLVKEPGKKELLLQKAAINDLFDQEEAVSAYEEVIRRYPEEAVAYNNLAMLYTGYLNLNLLNPKKALLNAEKACELTQNKDVGFLDTLARAYFVNGDIKQALELTRENIAKDDQRIFRLFLEMIQAQVLRSTGGKAEET